MAAGLRVACKSASLGLAVIDESLEGGGSLGGCWSLYQLWSMVKTQGAKALDVTSVSGVGGADTAFSPKVQEH